MEKIINGYNPIGQILSFFAILVSYLYDGSAMCGSTYIGYYNNSHWLVTAGHCINVDSLGVSLYFGDPNLNNIKDSIINANCTLDYKCIVPDEIIVHKDFNYLTLFNDIALIKLKEWPFDDLSIANLNISSNITININDLYNNSNKYQIIGYGKTSITGKLSYELKEGNVNILNSTNYPWIIDFDNRKQILAEGLNGNSSENVDTCHGDSGGPLYDNKTNTLLGITSWGKDCADTYYPGIYTYVPYYYDWILDKINNN